MKHIICNVQYATYFFTFGVMKKRLKIDWFTTLVRHCANANVFFTRSGYGDNCKKLFNQATSTITHKLYIHCT